jgi:hypothetical protein
MQRTCNDATNFFVGLESVRADLQTQKNKPATNLQRTGIVATIVQRKPKFVARGQRIKKSRRAGWFS